jgi:signal transduction histidine kinase
MASSVRRYRFGVISVALLGLAIIVGFVIWSTSEIGTAISGSLEQRARFAAGSYRDKLARALERALRDRRLPASEIWTRLDPMLEEAFESTPNLVGVVIRKTGGPVAAVIGPTELQRVPAVPPPGPGQDLALRLEPGDPPKVVVSFIVPSAEKLGAASHANLHLQFASVSALEHNILQKFVLVTFIVVVVVYVLAVLGYFIGRQGERAVAREREKAVRLKAIGEVAGAIAHELRNPLNAISLSFQVLGETVRGGASADGSRSGDLERARGEVQKISRVVDNFVSFARLSELNMTEVDLGELARDAFGPVAAAAAAASVRPEIHVEGPTRLRGDRDKLKDMLSTTLGAVLDAIKAAPGTFDLAVVGTGRDVTVTIRGRSERVDSRRVSNFASARRAWDEPVGLSLTIARTWIDCHGGTVSGVEPTADRAELVIVLPKGMM